MNKEVKKAIRKQIQADHDLHVWRHLHSAALGWKNGTLHDHDAKRFAARFGLEYKLKAPAFLDKIIEVLEEHQPIQRK